MKETYKIFFQLIRLGLGVSDEAVEIPVDAWKSLYKEAERQSMLGVVFEGVNRNVTIGGSKPPTALVLKWMGISQLIKRRNVMFDLEAKRLTMLFDKDGIFTVVLKGQGNEMFYPVRGCRMPGDIDIFVDGGKKFVVDWINEHGLANRAEKATYHHVHLTPVESGIDVEVHFLPSSGLFFPSHCHRLQKFLQDEVKRSVTCDRGFRTPSAKFNLLMQLAHIHCHFFSGGIGLRQINDFYYVLRHSSQDERREAMSLVKKLGIRKTSAALMWVLKEVFLLDDEWLLCLPNEKLGKVLLGEVFRGGNFGHYYFDDGHGFFLKALLRRKRLLTLFRFGMLETFGQMWFDAGYIIRKLRKTVL